MELYDTEMLSRLIDLLETPKELRDSNWITKFFTVLPTASLGSFAEQIANGPDGFPYFSLRKSLKHMRHMTNFLSFQF